MSNDSKGTPHLICQRRCRRADPLSHIYIHTYRITAAHRPSRRGDGRGRIAARHASTRGGRRRHHRRRATTVRPRRLQRCCWAGAWPQRPAAQDGDGQRQRQSRARHGARVPARWLPSRGPSFLLRSTPKSISRVRYARKSAPAAVAAARRRTFGKTAAVRAGGCGRGCTQGQLVTAPNISWGFVRFPLSGISPPPPPALRREM